MALIIGDTEQFVSALVEEFDLQLTDVELQLRQQVRAFGGKPSRSGLGQIPSDLNVLRYRVVRVRRFVVPLASTLSQLADHWGGEKIKARARNFQSEVAESGRRPSGAAS